MPTEVLVMCEGCGRPQPARPGPCVACGAALPEAPLPAPAAPKPPFLDLDLGGGRTLSGAEGRLTYRAETSAPPVVVELRNLQDAPLRHRPLFEALVPAVALAAPCAVVHALRPLAAVFLFLGVVAAACWRRYALELQPVGGVPLRWSLGGVRRGSSREASLLAAWIRLTEVLHKKEPPQRQPPGGIARA